MQKRAFTLILMGLLVSACTLRASNVPAATSVPDALYTQAVETILAQKTTSIETETPMPTNSPQPAITATASPIVQAEATATWTATILPSPTTTLTSTPFPTLSSTDPRSLYGEPAFRDTMNDAQNWPIYTDDHVGFEVKDGQMVLTAFNPDFYNGWMLSWIEPMDFYLEITGTHGACSGRDRFGVVFRAPDGNSGYLFGFSCDGRYSLWYWNGKEETDLVDWKSDSFILAGEGKTNRLGVLADGSRIALYANGNLLTEIQDSTSGQGGVGLFVGAVETENYMARVDELAYWNLR